jgi:lipopolysaccharide export system permease protein
MLESHRTLSRYVVREFLKILGLSLSSLVVLYVVILFLQMMDVFVKHGASFGLIIAYLLYRIPEVMFQWTLPYAVLLSTLLTLGTLSRHSEITAMKAGGVSLYRITFPLILVALGMSFISFLGNEDLVPYTMRKAQYISEVEVKKESPTTFFKNNKIWYHSDRRIFNIQLLDPKKQMLKGLTIYEFDDRFRCIRRIDAREARWADGKWFFVDGAIRDFDAAGAIVTELFKEKEFTFKEDWRSFQKVDRDAAEMSYSELRAYIQKIQSSGYDPTRYFVELYSKLSYPCLSLVMVLIGIPFALKTGRSGGIALSIGVSVLIGFAYGVLFYVSISFGKSGILPPLLAAWAPTLLFGLAGVFTLMSIRQ